MRNSLKMLGLVALVSLSPLSAVADELFLEQLAPTGAQLSTEQLEQVEASSSIEDIVALLVGQATDFEFIKDVIFAAVRAYPDKAFELVSIAVLEEPAAASVIVGAAISASGNQAAVVAIVKAAVTAAPAQVEAVRLAAIAAAPAQEDAINAAIDNATHTGDSGANGNPPSPSL